MERDRLTAGAKFTAIASRAVDIVRVHEYIADETVRAADFYDELSRLGGHCRVLSDMKCSQIN